MISEGWRYY